MFEEDLDDSSEAQTEILYNIPKNNVVLDVSLTKFNSHPKIVDLGIDKFVTFNK